MIRVVDIGIPEFYLWTARFSLVVFQIFLPFLLPQEIEVWTAIIQYMLLVAAEMTGDDDKRKQER